MDDVVKGSIGALIKPDRNVEPLASILWQVDAIVTHANPSVVKWWRKYLLMSYRQITNHKHSG